MSDPIFLVDQIRRRAEEAFRRGESIESNPYAYHEGATNVWMATWERMKKQAERDQVAA